MLRKFHETVENSGFHAWDDEYGHLFDEEEISVSEENFENSQNTGIRNAVVSVWEINNRDHLMLAYLLPDGVNDTVKTAMLFGKYEKIYGLKKIAKWIKEEATSAGNSGVKVLPTWNLDFSPYCDGDFMYASPKPPSFEDYDMVSDLMGEIKVDRQQMKMDILRKSEWVHYYTDGSAHGNAPVNFRSKWGVAGWIGFNADPKNSALSVTGYGELDNNQLETIAILDALRYHDMNRSSNPRIRIFSDSTVAIGRVNDFFRSGYSDYISSLPNVDAAKILDIYIRYTIELQWVRGHDTNKWHNLIDDLVGTARKIAVSNSPVRRGKRIRKFRDYEMEYLEKHMKWLMVEHGITESIE